MPRPHRARLARVAFQHTHARARGLLRRVALLAGARPHTDGARVRRYFTVPGPAPVPGPVPGPVPVPVRDRDRYRWYRSRYRYTWYVTSMTRLPGSGCHSRETPAHPRFARIDLCTTDEALRGYMYY